MSCKGICERYHTKRNRTLGYYAVGAKHCRICQIFLNWNGKFCPCCQRALRTKPIGMKAKENLEIRKQKGMVSA